ncbi:protein PFC0760c-like [Aphidius gifuensis]|uniref:protein PFC0760c-like n=1 Tax=Aphidius gifuensis TaxID=684658 RepID=UPI001CDBC0E9|nr:protein PFC0760c-like [Aphidius gifuensis]
MKFKDAVNYSLDCLKSNNYYDGDINLENETISWRAFTYGKTIYDFLIKIMNKMSEDNDNDWLLENQEVNQNCDVESMMENLFKTGEYLTIEAKNNQDKNTNTENNNAFVSFYNNNENNNNNCDGSNSSYDEERALEYLQLKKKESETVVVNSVVPSDLENFDNTQYNKDNKLPDNFFTKLTRDAEEIIVHHNSRSYNEKYDIEEFSPRPRSLNDSTENNEDSWTKLNGNCFVKIESDDVERALDWIEENKTDTEEDDDQKLKVDQNDKDPWMGAKGRCSLQLEPDDVDPLEWIEESETIENDYQQESFEIKSNHLINSKADDENNEDPWIKLRSRCWVQLNSDDVERALEWIEENKTDASEDDWQQESDTFKINSDGIMKLTVSENDEGAAWINSKRRCSLQLEPDDADPFECTKETIKNDYQKETDISFEIKSNNLKKLKVDQKNDDPWIKLGARCSVQIKSGDVERAHEWIGKKEKIKEDYEQQFTTPGKINSDDLIIGDLVYVKCLEHKFNNKKLGDELIRHWAREVKEKMKKNNKPFNPNIAWTNKFKKYYNITGDKSDLKVNYNSQVKTKNSESSYHSNDTHSNKNYSNEPDYSPCAINKKEDDIYLYYSDNFTDQYDDDDDYYSQNHYNKKIKKEKQDNFYRSLRQERSKKLSKIDHLENEIVQKDKDENIRGLIGVCILLKKNKKYF